MTVASKPSRGGGLALVVVDVQNAAVARAPHRSDEVLANIARLLKACRAVGVAVIHVRHDDGPDSVCAAGTNAWEIHESVRPTPGEAVIDKRFNSAFRDTDLAARLAALGAGRLIVAGIQTEYCVDTTVRVAFEFGFEVIVAEATNTTYDNGDVTAAQLYELYNRRIFDGRFAVLMPIEDTLALIRNV